MVITPSALITATAFIPTTTPTIPAIETTTPFPTRTPFIPKATIQIVAHAPLTGGGSREGNEMARASQLAVTQLAGPLTELGYQLELVLYDDQANAATGVANAKEIAATPEILCGIGHYHADVTVQASEIYHQAGLAFISPANTLTTVTDRLYPEINRLVGRDDGQGMAGARFAQEQGFERVYIVHNTAFYSEKIADYFLQEANRLDLQVVGKSVTDLKANFEWVIRLMMISDPDLVYMASKVDQSSAFFKEARAAGYTGAFLGTDGMNRPALAADAGQVLMEGGGTYITDMIAPPLFYPQARQFLFDFHDLYGESPVNYAAQAYDATGICIKAIEEASLAKGGELPSRKEVAQALRKLQDYTGLTGTFNFNNKGDLTLAAYYFYQVASADPGKWDRNPIIATVEVEPPR